MIFIDHQELSGGKIALLALKGKLDSETAGDFESFVTELLENGKRFILMDVEELEYCSSAGIGLLLFLQKKIVALEGMMALCGASEEIGTLFAILGLDRLISIAESRKEGIVLLEKHMQFNQSVERPKGQDHAGTPPPSVEVFEVLEDDRPSDSIPSAQSRTENMLLQKTAEETDKKGDADFEMPLVVECAECGTFSRVMRSGTYLCPECHTEFTVEKDQTIIF